MNEFLLGFLTCIGILFYVWSLIYAICFFVERNIDCSLGTLLISMCPVFNSILAIIYFTKGGKRL